MQIPAPTMAQPARGLPYKWIVACVVTFGIFMSVLDSTIVNIAIPRLQGAFGADLNSVQWVLTGYTLAQGVATPLTGFLSDRIGLKRFYLLSLTGFIVGSALCGLAWSLPVLILFRIIQGATGAFLSPLAITLLYQEFAPQERGMAMGVLGIPILLAPAFGPTLGGYIVTFASWQLIFYINVPIGILGLVLASIYLHNNQRSNNARFDLPGFLLSASGLGALLYGLSDASTDGWGSGKVLACLIGGVILLIIFTVFELNLTRREKQPLLDLRVFANGPFATSNIASVLVVFALYGGLFLVPVYLQNLRGLSAYQAGLLLLPQAFASMVAVIIGGRLVDRIGVRAVVIPGLVIMAISMWLLSSITADMPYGELQLRLIARSFAIGLCLQPLMVSALVDIQPRRLAQASAVNTTLRFVASSLGIAVLATLVQSQTTVHYAHLAERVTPTSKLGQLVPEIQALLMSHGTAAIPAHTAALQEIGGLIQLQAAVLALQDAFWLTFALAIAAIIASFFVRSKRRQTAATEQPLSEEERAELERAREEAAMGI